MSGRPFGRPFFCSNVCHLFGHRLSFLPTGISETNLSTIRRPGRRESTASHPSANSTSPDTTSRTAFYGALTASPTTTPGSYSLLVEERQADFRRYRTRCRDGATSFRGSAARLFRHLRARDREELEGSLPREPLAQELEHDAATGCLADSRSFGLGHSGGQH